MRQRVDLCRVYSLSVAWASSEYSNNNVRYVNSNGNCNNANKNNDYFVVPVQELKSMSVVSLKLVNAYTYADIMNAYLDCRHRKRGTRTAVQYEVNFERNLMALLDEINTGAYTIAKTRVFAIAWPKPREVWAANFKDRIVHHLIYNSIGAWYEKRFIEDTYSCIKKRGTLAASLRLEHFCNSATQNWSKPAWYLQIDIANFFVSIDRQILWDVLKSDIGETSLTARLVKQVVFNDPTENASISRNSDFTNIPRHKSLWHCPAGKGLPIGNLTSQFFSNVYLDALDKYVKHELKVKWYVRYVDDAVLLSHDKNQLYELVDAINCWLVDNRMLALHPNKTTIGSPTQGINFVGRILLPHRSYIRRMIAESAKKHMRALQKDPLNAVALEQLQSYLGHMKHSNSYNLRKHLCESVAFPMTIGHDNNMTKVTKLY